MTGGVHSAFVYKQEKFGTFIFLTNDGTGALHVLDVLSTKTRGRSSVLRAVPVGTENPIPVE